MSLSRRGFLKSTAALGLGMLAGRRAFAAPSADPLFKISLAEWSLHNSLHGKTDLKITNLDFAQIAKEKFGIEGIEYVNQFFKDKATDEKYLAELNKRAADHGVTQVLIMVDGEGALGNPDAAERQKAVENHHKWVTAAKTLGCHSIRVNAQSKGSYEEQQKLAAEGLAKLTEFASGHGINVIVENHGGLSSNGEWLASVLKAVNSPYCGSLPDFGNFRLGEGKTYDRYKGVAELMPYAKAVSAKTYDFGSDGGETTIDYLKMMKIVMDAGYHGFVGIEYEGRKLSEPDGIMASKKLLETVRDELAKS